MVTALAVVAASFAKTNNGEIRDGTIRVVKQVEADFPGMAKITLDQAVQKALAVVQGQVLKIELEDENGFLVYGVEVVRADRDIVDVSVDAGSGKVLAIDLDYADEREEGGYLESEEEDHEDRGDRDRED